MENNKFLLYFDTFINFLYKYHTDFNTFSNNILGSFKSNNRNIIDLFQTIDNVNFSNSHIIDNFMLLLEKYTSIKLSDFYFSQDTLYIRLSEILKVFLQDNFKLCSNSLSDGQVQRLKQIHQSFTDKINNNEQILRLTQNQSQLISNSST